MVGLEASLPSGDRCIHEVECSGQLSLVKLTTTDVVGETLEVLDPSSSVVRVDAYQAFDCDDGHSSVTGCAFLLPRTMPAGCRAELG